MRNSQNPRNNNANPLVGSFNGDEYVPAAGPSFGNIFAGQTHFQAKEEKDEDEVWRDFVEKAICD